MTARKQTPNLLAEILGGSELPAAAETTQTSVWEYLVISFQDYKGWRARYRNGEELANWTNNPPLHEYLQQLGEQGWELAAASAGEKLYGSSDTRQLYFKKLTSPSRV